MIDNLFFSIDKMIKHNSIFTLSKPTPSEADVMIKIWADIFDALFYSTGIYSSLKKWCNLGSIPTWSHIIFLKLNCFS